MVAIQSGPESPSAPSSATTQSPNRNFCILVIIKSSGICSEQIYVIVQSLDWFLIKILCGKKQINASGNAAAFIISESKQKSHHGTEVSERDRCLAAV